MGGRERDAEPRRDLLFTVAGQKSIEGVALAAREGMQRRFAIGCQRAADERRDFVMKEAENLAFAVRKRLVTHCPVDPERVKEIKTRDTDDGQDVIVDAAGKMPLVVGAGAVPGVAVGVVVPDFVAGKEQATGAGAHDARIFGRLLHRDVIGVITPRETGGIVTPTDADGGKRDGRRPGNEVEGVADDDNLGVEERADTFGEVGLPGDGISAEFAAFTGDVEAVQHIGGTESG